MDKTQNVLQTYFVRRQSFTATKAHQIYLYMFCSKAKSKHKLRIISKQELMPVKRFSVCANRYLLVET